MRIDAIDAFYLSMPKVEDIADGSQDMLLVKVSAGARLRVGENARRRHWVSIASLVCPMSHSVCRPVLDSVCGERIESGDDIARIVRQVRANSLDLLQAPHTLSGIEIALWDLLGKARRQPVYQLLGYEVAKPKVAYASALFRDLPEVTRQESAKTAGRRF